MIKNISILDIQQQLDETPESICLDVRTEEEHKDCHIAASLNIPLDQLPSRIDELKGYSKIYVHCGGGGRAKRACEYLLDRSNAEILHLDGGIRAWSEAGMPTSYSEAKL